MQEHDRQTIGSAQAQEARRSSIRKPKQNNKESKKENEREMTRDRPGSFVVASCLLA